MNKKILIIGPIYFGYNESVERPFRELGWSTEVIGYYEDFPKNPKNFLFYKILPKLKVSLFKERYIKKLNHLILEVVKETQPSLILIIKGTNIEKETLEKIKMESKLVLWMMDSIYRFKDIHENLHFFDYKFMFEETDVSKLEAENIHSVFLPMAADSYVYYPIKEERDIDILFVGKLYPNRLALFDRLINNFPEINIKIYGKYTNYKNPLSYLKYFFTDKKKYYTNQFVLPEELNHLYSKTKIAINIHHSQSQTGCNPRVFEILATNTFQIVDQIPYIKDNFKDDNLLASFTNEDELFNKIDYYIKNKEERDQIAKNGYQNIIQNHTFSKRIETILDMVETKV